MPERTEFAAGEPSWADLTTTDVDTAATFYRSIFGWEAEAIDDPDAGGYTMLTLDGKYVGALSPTMPNDPSPPHWNVYLNVDDADKVSEIAASAGGTVVVPTMQVFTSGKMAILQDPTGAFISVWQAQDHKGAAVTDEPGTLTWVELTTTDTAKAKAFYTEVFGWSAEGSEGEMPYTEFKIGDTSVAGMMAKPKDMPAGIPSNWMPYFKVVDADKKVGEITAAGGNVIMPGTDIPTGGRFAVAADPTGAVFGLYQSSK